MVVGVDSVAGRDEHEPGGQDQHFRWAGGAGQELPQDFEWTLETAAASVGATIGRMTSGPVHLVGHSMGGSVALTLAAARPDLVATLTLVGMVPAPPNAGFRNLIREQLEQGHFDAGFVGKCMRAWCTWAPR